MRQGSCKQIVDLYLESFADVASPGVGERRHGPDGGPEPGDADKQRRATTGDGVEASQRLRDDFVAVDGDQRQRVDRVESADSRHKPVPLARCRVHVHVGLQVNSALHPSGVAISSTSFGWGKGENVTSAGWQVTLCDPMWHVSSRSCVATLRTAIHLLLTYLLTVFRQNVRHSSQ